MVSLDYLRTLRTAVDAGSLTAAARQLGCSQPWVTRQLQRLEAELGTALLDRSVSGVCLTAAGEEVLSYAIDALDGYDALHQRLRRQVREHAGFVQLVASTIPGEHLAPTLLMRFAELHSEVRTTVTVQDSAAVPIALVERRAHFGLAGRRSSDLRLTNVPFARDEVVLAVPANHRLASRKEIPLAALQGERLIGREEGSGTQRTFFDAVTASGQEMPEVASTVSLGSTQAVLSAVSVGMGVAILSLRALQDRRVQDVVPLRVSGMPLHRTLWFLFETDRRRSMTQVRFLRFAMSSVQVGP